jgi:hypothetical protein
MNRRRSLLGVSAGVLAAGSMMIAGPANAASRTEYYQCNYDPSPPGGDPNAWRICDGTWYHAQPDEYYPTGTSSRSIRVVAEISYNPNTDFRTTAVYYAANLFPDDTKRIDWFCQYPNGTSSARKASTTLDNTVGPAHSWNPRYQPCNGYGEGMIAQVHGKAYWCCARDNTDYVTTIYINSWSSGTGYQAAYQIYQNNGAAPPK